jgi:hypothetical protein
MLQAELETELVPGTRVTELVPGTKRIKYGVMIDLCIKQLHLMKAAILENWREEASNYTRSGFVNQLMHCFSNGNAAWDQAGFFRGIDWSMFENPEEAAVGGNDNEDQVDDHEEAAVGGNAIVLDPDEETGGNGSIYQQVDFGSWVCAAGDKCNFGQALQEANFTFNTTEWSPKHRCRVCQLAAHSPAFCGSGEDELFICLQCSAK